MKRLYRLQRRAMLWLLCVALTGVLGGVVSGCGTIHTYGGVEHSFGYDFDDYDVPHHHHKDYKKYRKEQKKRYKAYKKHQKKMEKERRKHYKHHHHDDD